MNQMREQFLQHELSAAFPAMPSADLAALAEDIKLHGQIDPGVVFEGKVLDGWHRFQACSAAGIRFKTIDLPVDTDPVAFVKSRNFHRRHMTESQRAGSIVACSKWRSAGRSASSDAGQTNAALAKEAEVSERTISDAKVAHEAGLGQAVVEGKISAKKAAQIAKKNPRTAKKIAEGKLDPTKLPKIVPRAAQKETKPAPADPLDVAREHAKAQNKKIRELKAAVAERDERIAELTADLEGARENAIELAHSLEAYTTAEKGVKEAAEEIKTLKGKIRVIEATRDQHMTTCNELKRTVKALQAKLDKLK
jgi:hypothetical protein